MARKYSMARRKAETYIKKLNYNADRQYRKAERRANIASDKA